MSAINAANLHILEAPEDFTAVENLQRVVWPGDEVEIVPAHLLIAAVHSGGLLIGAYAPDMVGFVFGFPGLYATPDGPRLMHYSHMLAVHPDYRNSGVGFLLKRAQWQMVRRQGLDRITWTYDPLLSRNAHLNIARLGAVCNTYLRDHYGELRDGLNRGVSTDRFQVDWWVNSQRVERRLSKHARRQLDLANYLAAGIGILNPTRLNASGLPLPQRASPFDSLPQIQEEDERPLLMVEIPADFSAIKSADLALAQDWRLHTREVFEGLFTRGYLITDFIHLPGATPRSFYVFSHGEAVISGIRKNEIPGQGKNEN